jgi:16S rRNA (uracil1498-N3)-methyltransferase
MPRFYTSQDLTPGSMLDLAPSAARHVQVLRLQPGAPVTLFNGLDTPEGEEGEYSAVVQSMGRSSVSVVVGDFVKTRMEPSRQIHIAIGMPANDRMDWLVEKATELGVTSIAPLMTERSVLRLAGERLEKKWLHWRGVAIAACEQCGRSRVPTIHAPSNLSAYLQLCQAQPPSAHHVRRLLSLQADAPALTESATPYKEFTLLGGPEGGLSPAEELAAQASGFSAVTLGTRILRSETAPLAVLAYLQMLPD